MCTGVQRGLVLVLGGLLLMLAAGVARDILSWEQLDATRDIAMRVLGSSGSPEAMRRSKQGPRNMQERLMPTTPRKKFQTPVGPERGFPCPTEGARSPSRPSSVHQLRPGDMDVVAAMGDSLTSGNGVAAAHILQVLVENKGMSWSIGGQSTWREFLTLPNILKEMNPRLVGFSTEDTWSHKKASLFNVAEAAAMSQDMLFQAKLLVRRMASDSRVDMNNDWKMVTIMFGNNDFCTEMCFNTNLSKVAENHRADLEAALDYLRDNLPRTFVSIVPPPNVAELRRMKGRPFACHLANRIECTCLFSDKYVNLLPQFEDVVKQFQQAEEDLVNSGRYDDKKDFAAVFQPYTKYLRIPLDPATGNTDFSYMSYDCFHVSQKSHALAANALWNNLLEPVGAKTEDWSPLFERFLCPSESRPYIYTRNNSKT